MKKRYWFLIIFLIALVITWFSGPVPEEPIYSNKLPVIPNQLEALQNYVATNEKKYPVREDNEARIIFHNNKPVVTEFSIVYLHGFAGSYRDAYPVNVNIADSLNANIYLARWAGHGLKAETSLQDFNGENAWESAKEALAIGEKLGKKVIIMSTSTGGTLAFKLAAEFPDKVYALINMAPNIEDDQPGTFVLNSPWGYEIAKLISFGKKKKIEHEQKIARKYWDTIYPSKALVDLQVLVETTMLPETFKNVTCPVLTLYYHENFMAEDEHVEVDVYEEFHALLGTPDELVSLKSLATPKTHFVGSDIKSSDIELVEKEILEFLREKLKINLDTINEKPALAVKG